MKNFEGFGLSQDLCRSLTRMNYATPTPIQEKAIPLALQGKDILGSAQTGTGKTAAFSIPLVEAVLRNPHGNALVLTPTRELAKQVLDVIHQLLGPQSPIRTAFVIGGEPMGKQFQQLRQSPRIIVGTPGRINDHLERGLTLNKTNFLVLDETDRMLDMGFGVQLDRILKYLPAQRQTLMFSATLPRAIVQMSAKYLNNPERVAVGETNIVAPKITQEIIHIEHEKKYEELINQLTRRAGSVIIFSKTKYGSEKMARKLCRDGFEADALHGDLRQNKRTSVMNRFRRKDFRILVATDIAARGLDVPHIEHVINYDLPQVAEDYIHRMGRTARAGAEGSALCFISPQEADKWRAIERLLQPAAAREEQQQQRGSGGRQDRKDRHNRRNRKARGHWQRNDRQENSERPRHRGHEERQQPQPQQRKKRPHRKGNRFNGGNEQRPDFQERPNHGGGRPYEGKPRNFRKNRFKNKKRYEAAA